VATPNVQGVTFPGESSTGDIAVDWPTHQAGDLGILIFEGNNAAIQRTISGWTDVEGLPEVSSSSTLQMKWRIAESSSESFVTIQDIGDHIHATILTIRGVNPSNPFQDVSSNHRIVSSTTGTFVEVTTNQANSLIVAVCTRGSDNFSTTEFSGWNLENVSDTWTEHYDYGTTSGDGGGIGIASVVWSGSGSTSYGSVTTVTATYQCCVLIAFNPLGGGARIQFIGI
jgi:hypothetical protein